MNRREAKQSASRRDKSAEGKFAEKERERESIETREVGRLVFRASFREARGARTMTPGSSQL